MGQSTHSHSDKSGALMWSEAVVRYPIIAHKELLLERARSFCSFLGTRHSHLASVSKQRGTVGHHCCVLFEEIRI